jgi:endonuclease YncB( thermonuclease family)
MTRLRGPTRPALFAALAALLLAAAIASAQPSQRLEGRVVAVHDGDTITILDREERQHRIRVAGIDAPESGQPYGRAAKNALSRRVYDRWVRVEVVKLDHYGRIVGKVTQTGRDVGRDQVEAGMAWWLRVFAEEQSSEDQRLYEAAEARARESRRGLWRERTPVEPWLWRREHPRERATG